MTMIGQCLLETDGYRVLFQLKHLDTSKEYFDEVTIENIQSFKSSVQAVLVELCHAFS